MSDNHSPEIRSFNMSRIRSKNTKPEEKVRKYLFSLGFRYRKNVSTLPGRPDIVLPKFRTVIFVNGCFWHMHSCGRFKTPGSNQEYWIPKLERNVVRDKENHKKLSEMNWNVITVWECELTPKKREETLESIAFTLNHIWLQDHQAKVVPFPKLEEEDMQMPMAAEE